jgi:predicted molibdopterin-dependent oxidoreductase YjgC
MFKRLPDPSGAGVGTVAATVDGAPIVARRGDTVAAALLAAGCIDFRATPVIGSRRGPYCMMGVCYDCLVTIDGEPNQQACMRRIEDGMRIEKQQGARSLPIDAAPASAEIIDRRRDSRSQR